MPRGDGDCQKLADDNPAVTLYQGRLACALNGLGDVVRSLGWVAESKASTNGRSVSKKPLRARKMRTTVEQRYFLICSFERRGLARRDLGEPAVGGLGGPAGAGVVRRAAAAVGPGIV